MESRPGENGAREVRLGDLSFFLDGPDIRYLRWRGVELVRRIYVTVRDEDWDVPALELERVAVAEREGEQWGVAIEAANRSAAVDVDWSAAVEAEGDGRLSYAASFAPRRPFSYARMGLCVLLAPDSLIGREYEAWVGDERETGTFAASIAPQVIRDEEILPLFPAFERLRLEIPGAGVLDLRIEGDLLEMEDQRNWSDGSFKAYCTPLSLPRPQRAEPGRAIEQRIELELTPTSGAGGFGRRRDEPLEVVVGGATGTAVPPLGTVLSGSLPAPAREPLRRIGLEHLRVELRRPGEEAAALEAGADAARELGAALMPALFLTGEREETRELARLLNALEQPPARVLVFPREGPCERGELTRQLREELDGGLGGVPLVGGTDVWFVDLNRARPGPAAMDGVAWSLTPGVHAVDPATAVEGIAAQADQVRTAAGFAPGLQLVVGPVSLRPRYNPNARDARAQALEPPPASVDPRQGDPFAAAWTAGSVAALSAAGAHAATYYEAVGPRGIVGADGEPFPLAEVLERAAAWRERPVFATAIGEPLALAALAVGDPGSAAATELMLANLGARAQRLRVRGLGAGPEELELGPYAVEVVRATRG